MSTLTISLVQGATRWHDISANCAYYAELLGKHRTPRHSDLFILPESFLSGFDGNNTAIAMSMDSEALRWMQELAATKQAVICGSLPILDDGKLFNRLIWMRPDGSYEHYDKRHLFRQGGEHERYSSGSRRLVVELKGWRILPQICYDLRFPVWLRNRQLTVDSGNNCMEYDLALFVANWPVSRCFAWKTLLHSRSIENQSYVVGVNRTGFDGNNLRYSGASLACTPWGDTLLELGDREQVATIQLDLSHLQSYRERFPAWMDADEFELTMLHAG